MNGSGLVCLERRPLGYQETFQMYCSLTKYGSSACWTYNSPLLVGRDMDNTVISTEKTEISVRVQQAFLFRGSYRGSWTEPIWAKGTPL